MTTNGWNNWTGFGEGQRGWKASGVMALLMLIAAIRSYHQGDYLFTAYAAFVLGVNLEKLFCGLDAK